jgi:glycosyltransferase involved in cell wall biosynthesis
MSLYHSIGGDTFPLRADKVTTTHKSVQPLVSIGMPVYNGERYLRETLESLLSQTYENIELIISDDFSADSTEQICLSYASKDSRLSYHRQPENGGITANFNRLLGLAKGDYFMWAAQDDLWAPSFIERCLREMESDKRIVFCSSKTAFISADGEETCRLDADLTTTGMGAAKRIMHYLNNTITNSRPIMDSRVYGLIRASALNGKSLADIIGQDYLIMVELLTEGDLKTVDAYLFKKRKGGASEFHLKLAKSYRVTSKRRIVWYRAHLLGEFLNTVLRSPAVSLHSKIYLSFALPAFYMRHNFYHDLTFNRDFRIAKKLAYLSASRKGKRASIPVKILFLFYVYLLKLKKRPPRS